jgi:probable HAF family extracellular repeat protein
MQPLDFLSVEEFSRAYGVSENGSVIVGDFSGGPFRWEDGIGVEYSYTGKPNFIFQSPYMRSVRDVSDDGSTIVGYGFFTGTVQSTTPEPMVWSSSSGLMVIQNPFLYDPNTSLLSSAFGVSADGEYVVGNINYGSFSTSGDVTNYEAFRWSESGGTELLGFLPRTFSPGFPPPRVSVASDISSNGSVVVGYGDTDTGVESFRWTEAEGMVGIGKLNGKSTLANAVSADGSVVVGATGAPFQAFIWDINNGIRDLKSVLENDYGADLSGWSLEQATGISGDGRIVVGNARNPFGREEAFLVYLSPDSDNDGLVDYIEDKNGNGVFDLGETDLHDDDTDGDGLLDGFEDRNCNGYMDDGETSPLDADTDDDGLTDSQEDANKNNRVDNGETSPVRSDTDFDGVQDGTELGLVTGVPDTADSFIPDEDSLTTTDPTDSDTDGDGSADGQEDKNANGAVDSGESDPNNIFDFQNLLNNADFENDIEDTTSPNSDTPIFNNWGGDETDIVSSFSFGGFNAFHGNYMLRFLSTMKPGDQDTEDDTSESFQFVDLASYADIIGQGLGKLRVSGRFNRVIESNGTETDSLFQISVYCFNGTLRAFEPSESILVIQKSLLSDDDQSSWEFLELVAGLPPETTYCYISFSAVENRQDDATGPEFNVHVLDFTNVAIELKISPDQPSRTIFVAPEGDDRLGNGTADGPYSSLNRAVDAAYFGDTICLTAGTYVLENESSLVLNNISLVGEEFGSKPIVEIRKKEGRSAPITIYGDALIDNIVFNVVDEQFIRVSRECNFTIQNCVVTREQIEDEIGVVRGPQPSAQLIRIAQTFFGSIQILQNELFGFVDPIIGNIPRDRGIQVSYRSAGFPKATIRIANNLFKDFNEAILSEVDALADFSMDYYNNTFVDSSFSAWIGLRNWTGNESDTSTMFDFRNNIMSGGDYGLWINDDLSSGDGFTAFAQTIIQEENNCFNLNEFSGVANNIVTTDLGNISISSSSIEADPDFVAVANEDYRLRNSSPCLDKGDNIPEIKRDLLGMLRPLKTVSSPIDSTPVSSTGPELGAFDIGCYERCNCPSGVELLKPFENVRFDILGNRIFEDRDYTVKWDHSTPFPFNDGDFIDNAVEEYTVTISLFTKGEEIILGSEIVTDLMNPTLEPESSVILPPGLQGFWRLKIALDADPNQYVLSDTVYTSDSLDIIMTEVGAPVPPPIGVDSTIRPLIEEGFEEYFYWSEKNEELYPVRLIPGTPILVEWFIDSTLQETKAIGILALYPATPQIHIVDAAIADPQVKVTLNVGGTNDFANATLYPQPRGEPTSITEFDTETPGYAVLLYQSTDSGVDDVFEVIKSEYYTENILDEAAVIGTKIEAPVTHDVSFSGFILFMDKAFYDTEAYNALVPQEESVPINQIIPVNTDTDADDDDLVVIYFNKGITDAFWPSSAVRYTASWPTDADEIVIASGIGTRNLESFSAPLNAYIYAQNDRTKPGYNPNEEHAFIEVKSKPIAYALRNDLNSNRTSEPYVLVKWVEDATQETIHEVFHVVAENETYSFSDNIDVGSELIPPFPKKLGELQLFAQPESFSEALRGEIVFPGETGNNGTVLPNDDAIFYEGDEEEKALRRYAVAGPLRDSERSVVRSEYYYYLQDNFWYDLNFDNTRDDVDCSKPTGVVAFLHDPFAGGTQIDTPSHCNQPISYYHNIVWPEDALVFSKEETLVGAKETTTVNGTSGTIPDISSFSRVIIQYDQSEKAGNGSVAKLYDVNAEFSASLDDLPSEILTRTFKGKVRLSEIPFDLRMRIHYDFSTGKLILQGLYDDAGERNIQSKEVDFSILPALTAEDRDLLLNLSEEGKYINAINSLYTKAQPFFGGEDELQYSGLKALSAGGNTNTGYLTLAIFTGDDALTRLNPEFIVLKVDYPTFRGDIKVLYSVDDVFDENVSLRHNADFFGMPEPYEFEWFFATDTETVDPETNQLPDVAPNLWAKVEGADKNRLLVTGGDESIFIEKFYTCRYKIPGTQDEWSDFTKPSLYQGYLARVTNRINYFNQLVDDFRDNEVDTTTSLISFAGTRYEGNVALEQDDQSLGLFDIYQTLLDKAKRLSIEAANPFNDSGVNKDILSVASRINTLYTLFGYEAYADAADPTIGFGDNLPDLQSISSLFCFKEITGSLLNEELSLLRGRDVFGAKPNYNKLPWNFSGELGESAYANNYGVLTLEDAKDTYPQGHGDAWGHFLSGLKIYYDLLRNENYDWEPRSENITIDGQVVEVNFEDERRMAATAAAKAKAGAEIVNLTYRSMFDEDPKRQWQGYPDIQVNRAWGLTDWANRVGQGTYLDWVMCNAVLPDEDTENEGIGKIDRTTVTELAELPSSYSTVQTVLDNADTGLNPLGLAKNALSFDINPSLLTSLTPKTHFEQMYDKAVGALNNAISVFDFANQSGNLLRNLRDEEQELDDLVEEREQDYTNRLIEIFGYPYPDDCGLGKTYPDGYCEVGPDIYHYDYIDSVQATGRIPQNIIAFPVQVGTREVNELGLVQQTTREIIFHVDEQNGRLERPNTFTGRRKAPGEIQLARIDLIKGINSYEQGLLEYRNLLAEIEQTADLIRVQQNVNRQELIILNQSQEQQQTLNSYILNARRRSNDLQRISQTQSAIANALAEALPTSLGFIAGLANGVIADWTSAIRSSTKLATAIGNDSFLNDANSQTEAAQAYGNAKETLQSKTNIRLTALRNQQAIRRELAQLESQVRREGALLYELFSLQENLKQLSGRYLSAIARGERLISERDRFRQRTAKDVRQLRYRDAAFRILQNDALQKYRAYFDFAAQYIYFAAKAYDYETVLPRASSQSAGDFLNRIVRERILGLVANGLPISGGLAGILEDLRISFDGLQINFDNPLNQSTVFSMRRELFRINKNSIEDSDSWRNELNMYRVNNLWTDVPEFRKYCIAFDSNDATRQPAIVIPFESTIDANLNFFGNIAGGGDSSFNPTFFATKIKGIGVYFDNYNNNVLRNNPLVYLIPVGEDVLRTPFGTSNDFRSFRIFDQLINSLSPFGPSSELLTNKVNNFIPRIDSGGSNLFSIKKFPAFNSIIPAADEFGLINPGDIADVELLVGRSVWNTQWLLIIPGSQLNAFDPDEGIEIFINGSERPNGSRRSDYVTDIGLYFDTYAFPKVTDEN